MGYSIDEEVYSERDLKITCTYCDMTYIVAKEGLFLVGENIPCPYCHQGNTIAQIIKH